MCFGFLMLNAPPLAEAQQTTRCGMEFGKWVCREDPPQAKPSNGGSTFQNFLEGYTAGQQNRADAEPVQPPRTSRTAPPPSEELDRSTIKFSAESVQELLVACKSYEKPQENWREDDAVNFAVCMNTIDGLTAGAIAATNMSNAEPLFCVPRGSTRGQRMKVFLNWAEDHPKQWQDRPISGVFDAMIDAFPCSKPETR
jgi:hypothetical protein